MTDVLKLPDGRVETIFVPEDFARLIDETLGFDAADYFRRETYTRFIDWLAKAIESDDWEKRAGEYGDKIYQWIHLGVEQE